MTATDPYIRCRWCAWKTLRWRTTETGIKQGPHSAFARLASHIDLVHPEKADQIALDLDEHERRMKEGVPNV